MADPVLELDAAASNVDGTNPGTAMLLVDSATGWGLMAFDAPAPELKLLWTSNIDMDGSRRADPANYENRTVTASLECERSTAALTQAQLRILGHKIGKIAREGGTLKVTYPSGNTFIFDLLAGSHNIAFNHEFVLGNLAQVTVSFTCLPGARGAEQDLGDNTETTLPCLIFTEASIPGDLDALGRLVVDEDSAANQFWLTWGIQSRYYDAATSAALFYEAEGRTAMGGSAVAAGPAGASGAGSNVMRNTALTTAYQAILSTQATAAGAHLSHIGTLHVYARAQIPATNTGTVSVALEWAEGDFIRWTRNTATAIDPLHEGRWRLVDLGLVTLSKVTAGTQRWEGRIIAKSTVGGDDIDLDFLFLVPATEGSGIASGVYRIGTATAWSARDDFTGTTSGTALGTRAAPVGGNWATSGDVTDFTFTDTPVEALNRATTTAGSSIRYAVLGSTNYSNVLVQGNVAISGTPSTGQSSRAGVIARWVDASNHLRAYIVKSIPNAGQTEWQFIVESTTSSIVFGSPVVSLSDGEFYKISILAMADGHLVATLETAAGLRLATVEGMSTVLATGGTLATGLPGFYDFTISTPVTTRWYDELFVSVPAIDAAVYASQSLEIRSDRVRREDSGGTLWPKPSSYEGDYLLVPPSGAESRTSRVIVKGSRNDPFEYDPNIDDISARLFVTPRYLNVPSA